MRREGRSLAVYWAIIGLLAFAYISAWVFVDRQARNGYADAAVQNHRLQIDLASEAMQTGFQKLLHESSILASYSFPEFLTGKRGPESMAALLKAERESYAESLVYSFYTEPGLPRFSEAESGAMSSILDSASLEAWKRLAYSSEPLVIPGASGEQSPYFMIFYAVRSPGRAMGLLGVVVSFDSMITKYLSPLAKGNGRSLFLLANDRSILWSGRTEDSALVHATSLPGEMRRIERIFMIGEEAFSIVEIDSAQVLRGNSGYADSLKILLLLFGLLTEAFVIVGVAKLRAADIHKRILLDEEKRLSRTVELKNLELVESELRFELVFDTAFDGILIMDEGGKILRCNNRAGALFGASPEALIGLKPRDLSPEKQADGRSSSEAESALLSECLGDGPVVFEWTHQRKDGSRFFCEVGMSHMHSSGSVFVVAMLRDVSERRKSDKALREALEDREILLRELHHRVKNNLQFMDSLIELQKRKEEPASARALAKMQSRIAALSTAYFVAAESPDDFRIDARRYFTALCAMLHDEAETKEVSLAIGLECDDVPIDLDSAVSLGLIVRELVINAAQHGYGAAGEGRVEVRFCLAKGKAELEVRDHGRGVAEGLAPSLSEGVADGLGLTLARALCLQLGGILEFESSDSGLRVYTSFTLA